MVQATKPVIVAVVSCMVMYVTACLGEQARDGLAMGIGRAGERLLSGLDLIVQRMCNLIAMVCINLPAAAAWLARHKACER